MLKEIHKFASVTSRPIAMNGTRKHTHGYIKGVVQPRNEHKMWNPWKTLVLHSSRETLARLLNRRIRHLCTTYKMQNVPTFYPKYAIYVWCSGGMIQDDWIWQSYMQWGMMLWHLLTSFFDFSLLLKSFILFCCMATLRNAQTKIAIGYIREQSFDTRDDMIPIWYGM